MSHDGIWLVVVVVVVAAVDPYTGKITNNFSGANFFLSFFSLCPGHPEKSPHGFAVVIVLVIVSSAVEADSSGGGVLRSGVMSLVASAGGGGAEGIALLWQ